MRRRENGRLATIVFATPMLFAFLATVPPDCATIAREAAGGGYEITCPILGKCGASICDLQSEQTPAGNWRHFCRCDDSSNPAACDGFMISDDEDPNEPGTDVYCFEEDTCGILICDEAQLDQNWTRLCDCK